MLNEFQLKTWKSLMTFPRQTATNQIRFGSAHNTDRLTE